MDKTDKLAEEIPKFLKYLKKEYPSFWEDVANDGLSGLALSTIIEAYHEAKLKEITDADIEVWAIEEESDKDYRDGMIRGAKAIRDGEIKHLDDLQSKEK